MAYAQAEYNALFQKFKTALTGRAITGCESDDQTGEFFILITVGGQVVRVGVPWQSLFVAAQQIQ